MRATGTMDAWFTEIPRRYAPFYQICRSLIVEGHNPRPFGFRRPYAPVAKSPIQFLATPEHPWRPAKLDRYRPQLKETPSQPSAGPIQLFSRHLRQEFARGEVTRCIPFTYLGDTTCGKEFSVLRSGISSVPRSFKTASRMTTLSRGVNNPAGRVLLPLSYVFQWSTSTLCPSCHPIHSCDYLFGESSFRIITDFIILVFVSRISTLLISTRTVVSSIRLPLISTTSYYNIHQKMYSHR